MAVRVIDLLETVQIEIKQGKRRTASCAGGQALQMFPHLQTIRQIGQSIVLCHISNTLFIIMLFRNIFVDAQPTAVRHWAMGDGKQPSIRQFLEPVFGAQFGYSGTMLVEILIRGLNGTYAMRGPAGNNLLQAHASPDLIRRETVKNRITFIGNQKSSGAIEHAQTGRHIVQRRFEA
jgi:hypothetical protein